MMKRSFAAAVFAAFALCVIVGGASAGVASSGATADAVVSGGGVFCFIDLEHQFGECNLNVVGNPDIEESTAFPCSTVPIPTSFFFTGPFACTITLGLVTVPTVNVNVHCVIAVPGGVVYDSTQGTIVVHPAVLPGVGPGTQITAHCPADRT